MTPPKPSRRDAIKLGATAAFASLLAARCAAQNRLAELNEPLAEYDLDPAITYFNHASTGTTPRIVRESRARYAEICERNPWLYTWGDAWVELANEARSQVAGYIHGAASELAIVRSTTEGMNILAQGLGLGSGDEVLFSSLNHVGASACFSHWGERQGYSVRRFAFPISDTPGLSPDDVVRLHTDQIRDHTRVLVFPHVDNMVGLRIPAKRLVAAARTKGVETVIVDGAQTIGMFDVDVHDIGADAYVSSGHKWLQTPKGFGLLHISAPLIAKVPPMIVTWGQKMWADSARRYEDFGTRDVASFLALGDAAAFHARLGANDAWKQRSALIEYAKERVQASRHLSWRSPDDPSLAASLVAVEPKGKKPSPIAKDLFETHGIVVRPFDALGTLRLSFNLMNTPAQIDRFVERVPA